MNGRLLGSGTKSLIITVGYTRLILNQYCIQHTVYSFISHTHLHTFMSFWDRWRKKKARSVFLFNTAMLHLQSLLFCSICPPEIYYNIKHFPLRFWNKRRWDMLQFLLLFQSLVSSPVPVAVQGPMRDTWERRRGHPGHIYWQKKKIWIPYQLLSCCPKPSFRKLCI